MTSTHQMHCRGFTLIEMVVVSLLALLAAAAALVALLTSQRTNASSEAYIIVQEQARRALSAMRQELLEAGGVMTPIGANNEFTFQVPLGYNNNPAIAGCPATGICWGAQDQTGVPRPNWNLHYLVNGGQLIREVRNGVLVQGTSRVLARDVSLLIFTRPDAQRINIQLQTQRVSTQLAGGTMNVAPTPLIIELSRRNP